MHDGLYLNGSHKCKAHNYEHNYVLHTCGHEFCPLSWKACPRCHGGEANNMLPGHPGYPESSQHRVTPLPVGPGDHGEAVETFWCNQCQAAVEINKDVLRIFADFDMELSDIGCPNCDEPELRKMRGDKIVERYARDGQVIG